MAGPDRLDPVAQSPSRFNLPLHTDLPTRELQPGVQFLYWLRNDISRAVTWTATNCYRVCLWWNDKADIHRYTDHPG
jgi:hypothetical protein